MRVFNYEVIIRSVVGNKTTTTKQISEPVISLADCIKQNPNRFRAHVHIDEYTAPREKFRILDEIKHGARPEELMLVDRKTGEHVKVKSNRYGRYLPVDSRFEGVFTHEENMYLNKAIMSNYAARLEKVAERRKNKERSRLAKIYCPKEVV